ncbi:hypothetical protein L1987_52350 [Smallanthus sonchifolius]|uniref:Uncharacterized protein n=1 Tax=Smallanthus sonchifolius TaxID=185202 RepID=A0ACB9ESW5_9ASTR|nr:hypothetical protein L1987_52350 [Smallanthus sonchifolius]
MIVEYEKIENQILIDRQKESDNINKSSNDDPSFDLHISQLTPYGDNILMGTQTVENVSKVITESEFLNTKEEEKPQAALQSQEPKEDEKKERPRRYKRMAELLCSPYLERVVSMREKRTILENNISSYLFSGYGDEWDEVFTISGKCNMPRFKKDTYDKSSNFMKIEFHRNMTIVLEEVGISNINAFELVFIPVIYQKHFYLMSFNLKTHVIEILDNIATDKYNGWPEKMIVLHEIHENKEWLMDSKKYLSEDRNDVDNVDIGEDDEEEPKYYVCAVKRLT